MVDAATDEAAGEAAVEEAGGTTRPFRIGLMNHIAPRGLARLPADRYVVGAGLERPDALLVRSADLHREPLPASLLAIGRAGAGTNNIPVEAMSTRGVPVFNAPGANANAVKELVLAAMLMAARHIVPALRFVDALDATDPHLAETVEAGKKDYAGTELAGSTLGIVGLGKIGCLVADAAIKLGMAVVGFDPHLTVDAAWSLPSQVRRGSGVDDVLRQADYVTLHVPLLPGTRGLVGAATLPLLRPTATLLNFSREGVVDEAAVLAALDAGRLAGYACDFPSAALHRHARVIALPHLGASTAQAEENCAVMVAGALRDFLEHGDIADAVNFPDVEMPRGSPWRIAIANANVPNMLGQISTAMALAGLNIHNMVNRSRGDMAYTLVDVDSPVPAAELASLRAIAGVLSVRYLPDAAG